MTAEESVLAPVAHQSCEALNLDFISSLQTLTCEMSTEKSSETNTNIYLCFAHLSHTYLPTILAYYPHLLSHAFRVLSVITFLAQSHGSRCLLASPFATLGTLSTSQPQKL